jgi:hypothetical protein
MSDLTKGLRRSAKALIDKAGDLQERIRRSAYAIWEREGRPHGKDQDHWHEAEKEVAAAAPPPKSRTRKSDASKTDAEPPIAPKRSRTKKSVPVADAATAHGIDDSTAPATKRRAKSTAAAPATGAERKRARQKKG